jgi:hypothetical protein
MSGTDASNIDTKTIANELTGNTTTAECAAGDTAC